MNKFFLIYPLIFFVLHFLVKNWKPASNLLMDKDLDKIQGFHNTATVRSGGILIFITWLFYLFLNKPVEINLNFLIYFSITNFLLGLFADTKLINSPIKRFFLAFFLNILIILYYDFYINEFNFYILDFLNSYFIFKVLLVFLAIFFITNGSNLIDGFNGLLSIHVLIILLATLYVGMNSDFDIEIKNYIFFLIFLNILFLILNFPNAKIFLGDCGAYFLGTQVACLLIYLSNNFEIISSFFIANILFYLFFEIFFSVFRKIVQRKNPFYPDRKHLHMLIYEFVKTKTKSANPITSVIINLIFLMTIVPSCVYFYDDFLCKIIFFIQIILYIITYTILAKKI